MEQADRGGRREGGGRLMERGRVGWTVAAMEGKGRRLEESDGGE